MEEVLVFGAGLHDNAFGKVSSWSPEDGKNPFQRTARAVLRAGCAAAPPPLTTTDRFDRNSGPGKYPPDGRFS